MTDFTYIGKQKGIDDLPDLHLVNCNHCGTTIKLENELKHLKEHHYPRYYEVKEAYKKRIAERYLEYLNK